MRVRRHPRQHRPIRLHPALLLPYACLPQGSHGLLRRLPQTPLAYQDHCQKGIKVCSHIAPSHTRTAEPRIGVHSAPYGPRDGDTMLDLYTGFDFEEHPIATARVYEACKSTRASISAGTRHFRRGGE
ncbi:hypothetical protein FIBSPDRAFT_866485 [Athelia psychrophila]|uniref:Uncharacterized protein n=1 Tax=Athelia psychrophila TaxID=1759441 RepID=A0A166EQA3_9AGAM|nr:hypothetical protein FIBSPDRAFT_866485 [Fibularhizoctonia sp. CBS 109695]